MRGFPKSLHTKEDYLYIKDNFEPEQWKPEFQKLLDTIDDWFFVKELKSKDDGIEDDTHKIIEYKGMEGESKGTKYYQYELRENPNAKISKIGFTRQEVEDILAS